MGVTTKEEAILRAQKIDLIYAQSGILYEIILDVRRSNTDFLKPNLGTHADGIMGLVELPTLEYIEKTNT